MKKDVIDNMILALIRKCTGWIREGEDGQLRLMDPLDGREISGHYGHSHAAAAFLLYGSQQGDEALVDLGFRLLDSLLDRWEEIRRTPDFHQDFNLFALCVIRDFFDREKSLNLEQDPEQPAASEWDWDLKKLRKTEEKQAHSRELDRSKTAALQEQVNEKRRRQLRKEIVHRAAEAEYSGRIEDVVRRTEDSPHATVNWIPMRWYVNRSRYRWTGEERYAQACEDCRRMIREASFADGWIDDRLPKGMSFSLQYDVASVAGLQFLKTAGEDLDLSRELGALLSAVAPDGDINYFGRGCNQMFAWGMWIYLLQSSGHTRMAEQAVSYLNGYLDQMLDNDNIMLNPWSGAEKYLWWDYHHVSVYVPHLLLWLVLAETCSTCGAAVRDEESDRLMSSGTVIGGKAAVRHRSDGVSTTGRKAPGTGAASDEEIGQKAAGIGAAVKDEESDRSMSGGTVIGGSGDSGVTIRRSEDCFAVFFHGRSEYPAEAGPGIEAFFHPETGLRIKGSFGPWQGAFGNHYQQPSAVLWNYFGLMDVRQNRDFSKNRLLHKLLPGVRTAPGITVKPLFAEVQYREEEECICLIWRPRGSGRRMLNIPSLSEIHDVTLYVDGALTGLSPVMKIRNQYDWVSLYQSPCLSGKEWVLKLKRAASKKDGNRKSNPAAAADAGAGNKPEMNTGSRPGNHAENHAGAGNKPEMKPGLKPGNHAENYAEVMKPGSKPGNYTGIHAGVMISGSEPDNHTENSAGVMKPGSEPENRTESHAGVKKERKAAR